MKRPSFQFYPADWTNNQNLKRCSKRLKGCWIDVMCVLNDSEDEYGIVRWSLADLANASDCTLKDLRELREKGVLKGADIGEKCSGYTYTPHHAGKAGKPVVLIPEQDGPIWYSSRMVRDEYKRINRATKGGMGESPDSGPKGGMVGRETGADSSPSRAGARAGASSTSTTTSPSSSTGGSINLGNNSNGSTDAVIGRAAAVAVLVRKLEHERGKAPTVTSADPRVIAWADAGVTDEQIKEAHALAVADRKAKENASPIHAGFLDIFVAKVLNPSSGQSRINGNGSISPTEWWSHVDQVKTKGVELGVARVDNENLTGGENWQIYRLKVLNAAGDGPWMVKLNVTDKRILEAIREGKL
jgi:hypothetical protein